MNQKLFTIERTPQGDVFHIEARGREIVNTPLLNRGSAFTMEERKKLNMVGLLPPPGGLSVHRPP